MFRSPLLAYIGVHIVDMSKRKTIRFKELWLN